MENRIVIGMSYDPWHNLALEEILFEQQAEQQGVTVFGKIEIEQKGAKM